MTDKKITKNVTRYFTPVLDPVHPDITKYLEGLHKNEDDLCNGVLKEMEEYGYSNKFPIIGRLVGAFLRTITKISNSKTIFEFGSGYGFSAYFFAQAIPKDGKIICTDGNPINKKLAEDYLTRAGLWDKIDYKDAGWAQDIFKSTIDEYPTFDIIYNDVDKKGYPEIFKMAKERLSPGGLYIADNTLWFGNVTVDRPAEDIEEGWTDAIKTHNQLIADDKDFEFFLNPIRDGVIIARKRA